MLLLRAISPYSNQIAVSGDGFGVIVPAKEGGSWVTVPGDGAVRVTENIFEIAALHRQLLSKAKHACAWYTSSGTIVSS